MEERESAMSRLEKKRHKRRLRLRAFVGVVLCLTLFCCGLSIVDGSSRDMLGNDEGRPIFGIYGLHKEVIRLELIGSEIEINKSDWEKAYRDIIDKINQLLGR